MQGRQLGFRRTQCFLSNLTPTARFFPSGLIPARGANEIRAV